MATPSLRKAVSLKQEVFDDFSDFDSEEDDFAIKNEIKAVIASCGGDFKVKKDVEDSLGLVAKQGIIKPKFEDTALSIKLFGGKEECENKENNGKTIDYESKVDSFVTPVRALNRLQNKAKVSLHKSLAKKQIRKLEDYLQQDVITLLSADLTFVHNSHIELLPMFKSLKNPTRLGEALIMKWPIFQQMKQELCAFSSTAKNNDQHIRMQTLHMSFVSRLIKECLLSRSYKDLSLVILPLTQFPKKCAELLWKVGSELIKHTSQPDHTIFVNMMKLLLHHVQQTNVYISSGILSIVDSVHNAQQVHQEIGQFISSERFSSDTYMMIFYGQLEYILWREEKEKWALNKNVVVDHILDWGGKDEFDEDEEEEKTKVCEEPRIMKYHGDRALQFFDCVKERSGVWDVILPKYIEIMSHYKLYNDARRVLREHAENNPENPMSHFLQLQWMTRKGGFETVEMLTVYRQLANIDPTNSMVKSLCLILNKEGNIKELLDILQKRLSHFECFDSLFDWNLLLDVLKSENRNISLHHLRLNETLKKTHFSLEDDFLSNQLSSQVRAVKAEIADILKKHDDTKPKPSAALNTVTSSTILPASHHVEISRLNNVTNGDEDDDYSDEEMREAKHIWMFSYDDVSSPDLVSSHSADEYTESESDDGSSDSEIDLESESSSDSTPTRHDGSKSADYRLKHFRKKEYVLRKRKKFKSREYIESDDSSDDNTTLSTWRERNNDLRSITSGDKVSIDNTIYHQSTSEYETDDDDDVFQKTLLPIRRDTTASVDESTMLLYDHGGDGLPQPDRVPVSSNESESGIQIESFPLSTSLGLHTATFRGLNERCLPGPEERKLSDLPNKKKYSKIRKHGPFSTITKDSVTGSYLQETEVSNEREVTKKRKRVFASTSSTDTVTSTYQQENIVPTDTKGSVTSSSSTPKKYKRKKLCGSTSEKAETDNQRKRKRDDHVDSKAHKTDDIPDSKARKTDDVRNSKALETGDNVDSESPPKERVNIRKKMYAKFHNLIYNL